MITTFRVQNYKALRDVTLNLTPMHLLIGPNDSGKTSILEALTALSRLTTMEPKDAFGTDWQGRELVWKHLDEPIWFSSDRDGKSIWMVKVYFAENGRVVGFNPNPQQSGFGGPFISQQSVEDAERLKTRRHEASLLMSPVEKFSFNARMMALPSAADPNAPFRLDETGFGLPRCLDYLVGTQRKKFRELEKWFQTIFPKITDVILTPQKGMQIQRHEGGAFHIRFTHDGKALDFHIAGVEDPIPARQMSDGVLIVLAFLTILSLPDPPKLLLIEEPENGIHPERLKEVITILRELLKEHPETQVVMTSHSPYIVSLFEPEEVTLCRKNDAGEVQVKRLSESQIVKDQMKIFSLGEIWPAEEERIFKESNGTLASPAGATP